jgi:hypothetical protein
MAEDAPPTQEELQQVFNAFDSDGTGTMSVEGMMDIMINQYVLPPIKPLQPPSTSRSFPVDCTHSRALRPRVKKGEGGVGAY